MPAANTLPSLVSAYQEAVAALIVACDGIDIVRASYDGYQSNGGTISDGDFTGTQAGITAAQFVTAVSNATLIADGLTPAVRNTLLAILDTVPR